MWTKRQKSNELNWTEISAQFSCVYMIVLSSSVQFTSVAVCTPLAISGWSHIMSTSCLWFLTCLSGVSLIWVNEIPYPGIFVAKFRLFQCSLESAKRSFYRAANAVFGKIGRTASEEVNLQVIKSKCLPVLLYGLEACPLTASDLRGLDFVVNRFIMKLFTANVMDTVKICLEYFNFALPSSIVEKRRKTFVARYVNYCY